MGDHGGVVALPELGLGPRSGRTATTPGVGREFHSHLGDLAHGVMEGEAEHAHKEVDGVAGQIALGPAPVALFDQEAFIAGQFEVVGGPFEQLEAALLEQRRQGGEAGRPDLLVSPSAGLWALARDAVIKAWVGHSLSSSGVEPGHG